MSLGVIIGSACGIQPQREGCIFHGFLNDDQELRNGERISADGVKNAEVIGITAVGQKGTTIRGPATFSCWLNTDVVSVPPSTPLSKASTVTPQNTI
ncbi:MAG: hypothetical protein Q8Q20_05350 [bacterium]|nr:hypothetical protein [bacterium]